MNRGQKQDRRTISKQPWERRYWSMRFRASESEVAAAIEKVGNRVEDVARALGLESAPPPQPSDPVQNDGEGSE
jgi:hypothetical protein